MDLENCCRTCLRIIPANPVNVLANGGIVLEKINSISKVKIEIHDGLPANICENCYKNINYIFNFQKLIKHTDDDLKSRLYTMTCTNYLTKPRKKSTKRYRLNAIESNNKQIKLEGKIVPETQRIHKCSKCEAQFASRYQLSVHRATSHNPLVVCSVCGVKLRQDYYRNHMAIHTAPKTCNICGLVLKNANSLRFHLRKHGKPTHECNICGKSYVKTSEYRRHYLRHTDPDLASQLESKPCSVCGKRVQGIKKHMLTHTGEKPHICPYCNKGFQGKYGLKVHIRQHTNERPYVCEQCGDTFAQTVSLKTHLKRKHGIKYSEDSI